MQNTVRQANIGTDEIALINAHGTSTIINDMVEAKAICDSLLRSDGHTPPVTAIKSMIGHTLGASGSSCHRGQH